MPDSLFRPGRRARVLLLLRSYTDAHVELTRHLARELGVNPQDAVALAEILWAENAQSPLSPARLADRIGLTSGATANLLNRLEVAGLIARSREDSDRRLIRLRLTPQARTRTEEFFVPTGQRVDRVLDGYDDDTLGRMEQLLTEVVEATASRNAGLRAAQRPGDS